MVSFKQGTDNPFGPKVVGVARTPIFADVEADEDLTTGTPRFTAFQTNPFGFTSVGSDSAPTFADIDSDGDLDAFIGTAIGGDTFFFQNTGSASSPNFATAQTNPFGLTNVASDSVPTFADIDGDGDLDAFIGDYNGDTFFFQNTGSASSPNFATAQTNPFSLTNVGNNSTPTFADIDSDGDLDAFIGAFNGDTFFFQNTGSASSPNFATAQTNPFGLSEVGIISAPTFADIDGDGDLDAFIGDFNDDISFFQNFSTNVPIPVSTNADSGEGSLRQAILTAASLPGSDTIDLTSVGGQTITLQSPLPIFEVGNDVNITGSVGNRPTISGGAGFQSLLSMVSRTPACLTLFSLMDMLGEDLWAAALAVEWALVAL